MAHQSDLYRRWSRDVRRSGLFRPGERVGVAVSGGPDSVLLFDFLRQLAGEAGLGLALLHFNHHLRGEESDADEKFVRELGRASGLDFLCEGADVARLARERRRNLEATARALRYRFFFSVVDRGLVSKVATAHTANDQAETVLLKLLRGAGTRGLGGIFPRLEGKVIRPFLGITRPEIERELARRRLQFRLDATNQDTRLRRNKIRRELIPVLEKEFNPGVVRLLADLAARARDDEACLEAQARELALGWRRREAGEERIPARRLNEFPPALARRVLRQMVMAARGSSRTLTHAHIESLLRFAAQAQSGRRMELPGGLEARKEFDWLVLASRRSEPQEPDFSYSIQAPCEVFVPRLGTTFRFKIVGPEERRQGYNKRDWSGLDLLRLPGELRLRNWRAGDSFHPPESRKAQKLKELFRQKKIPLGERKLWPLLESGYEIVWVRGFPPAQRVAATPDSGDILVVEEGATA